MADSLETIRVLFPWFPADALDVYYEAYLDGGDAMGLEAVRADSRYEVWFPGNLDYEGNVRYSESAYAGVRESYRDVLRGVGIQYTGIFEDRITELMEGEVSAPEFSARVMDVNDRVLSQSESIKAYYSENYGIGGLTTEAILAGALDPGVGAQILTGQLAAAEVGGEALESGFNLTIGRVEELVGSGMNRGVANELFQEAETLVPLLETLAQRHNDPDDDFDIEEFIAADFFKDPTQNIRMRRNIAQERALFRQSSSYRTSRTGGLTGLLVE